MSEKRVATVATLLSASPTEEGLENCYERLGRIVAAVEAGQDGIPAAFSRYSLPRDSASLTAAEDATYQARALRKNFGQASPELAAGHTKLESWWKEKFDNLIWVPRAELVIPEVPKVPQGGLAGPELEPLYAQCRMAAPVDSFEALHYNLNVAVSSAEDLADDELLVSALSDLRRGLPLLETTATKAYAARRQFAVCGGSLPEQFRTDPTTATPQEHGSRPQAASRPRGATGFPTSTQRPGRG
jgi:hypothetical protein